MQETAIPGPVLDVLIVGAGISGIGMAARLRRRLPEKSIAIVERRAQLGGTWDLFRYPGVRSDSDMYTLGYEFAPWRGDRSVARGEEILEYLQGVADEHELERDIRFGTKVLSANWDSAARQWAVACLGPDGAPCTIEARFLFIGAGYYDQDEPATTAFPGIDAFGGDVLHPQFWPEDADYAGKEVIVIGSGATAVTIVPAMAESAARVTMLQRTPSWYYAQPGHDALARLLRRLLPESWAYRLVRARNNALQYWFFRRARAHGEDVGQYLLDRVEAELGDRFDPADFTPPYGPWEQRLCFVPDGDLFAALREGTARIVTGRIERVTARSILLEDGRELAADVIVTATGLRLAPLGHIALSLDGKTLNPADHWYYRNCMLSNVPNFAALFGYLNAAWTLRVDLVAERLCRIFAQMDAWGADAVTPQLPDDHGLEEADALAGFSSGYLKRGRALIPRSAREGPWRLSHDYYADLREMREAPVDDGHLHFERAG